MRRGGVLLANVALGVFALGLTVAVIELALRLVPGLLPHGSYGASRYVPELLSCVHGSPVTYNKVRYVHRAKNGEGFLDVEHERAKPDGVVRVGFFGDSYVEAAQVPLEQVFFRLLPEQIGEQRLEPLGFGISGWGTLHSMLAYQALAARYELDVAVYAFVENDPGDNALEVQGVRGGRLSPKAYARLASGWPGYELVLVNPPDAQPWTFRIAKVIQERLLLGRLIWSRAALLHFGIALQLDDRDVQMTTRAGAVPRENDLPSSWPAPYRKRAEELGRRILSVWAATARTERRHFVMLYVPRGEDQLRGRLAPTDTWLPWLTATAKALDIPLIDPSNALARRMESGEAVYDDHWSPAGHEVVAGVLSDYLARWAKERER